MSLRLRPGFFFATLFFLLLGGSLVWIQLLRGERDLARLETHAINLENRALRQQLEAERILAAALAKRGQLPALTVPPAPATPPRASPSP